ncbi:MAG: efflux RND transporter periplasmic adaptor subunit [Candidatus Pacearchaeota archaeon]
MKNMFIKLVQLIFMIVLLVNCKTTTSDKKTSEYKTTEINMVELSSTQLKNSGIVLGKIEMKNLSSELHVNGILEVPPQNLVSITCPMGGFVKATDLLQGMKVRKGQIIALIQNPQFIELQQEYINIMNKYVYAEQEYKRQQELTQSNATAYKNFQQISAEYNTLKASYSAIRERLLMVGLNPQETEKGNIQSTVNILSPINGYVTEVYINIGKYIQPHEVLCEIVNTEHLHVELTVFEKDMYKIKPGQKVRFRFSSENAEEKTATIYMINKKISTERTVRVHAHMDKNNPELVPGSYLKAIIEISNVNVWAVPDEAIIKDANRNCIFIKQSQKTNAEQNDTTFLFKKVYVERGVSMNGYTEIQSSDIHIIKENYIVIKGAYYLHAKMNNIEED